MNRLILLGNGFDLAHGMKTSYNDFILWYLTNSFKAALKDSYHRDELLNISVINPKYDNLIARGKVSAFIEEHYKKNTLCKLMEVDESKSEAFREDDFKTKPARQPFDVQVTSSLFREMITQCNIENWVDIENLFYRILKQIISSDSQQKQVELNELNQSLSFIIEELRVYLTDLDRPEMIEEYTKLMSDLIQFSDIVMRPPLRGNELSGYWPKKTLILNFNYTDTADQYLKNNPNLEIIYIHGQINSPDNPMIFGFGDELDSEYSKFELDQTKQIFKYIKSFWYFKTSNYHNLLRFIQSDIFQVCIMGHSCGLSDRTMLNMIFEHENCMSIKTYYYRNPETGRNNYTELTEEISRHFKDKRKMRLKLVPFDKSSEMPQTCRF